MSQTTPLLGLPYLDAAQAQKHVIHNEALRMLDAVVQLAVADRNLAAPPAEPANGERYIVAAGASGAWTGRAGQVAAWQDDAWAFFAPAPGWLAWVADEGVLVAWDGSGWTTAGGGSGGGSESSPLFGVNATADATNRLSVKSDAVLLSHDDVTPGTGDMRAVANKADAANTASFLFQTDSSGRAEFGLTGDDDWHVKVSADGTNWTEALVADHTSGRITFLQGVVMPDGVKIANDGVTGLELQGGGIYGTVGLTLKSVGGLTGALFEQQSENPGVDLIDFGFKTLTDQVNLRVESRAVYSITGSVPEVQFFIPDNDPDPSVHLFSVSAATAIPGVDNATKLGSASFRWSTVYAGTGTINTSDARDKTDIEPLTEAEIAAALGLAREIGTFQFLDSIEKKGADQARLHAGMTVQRAVEIMQSHGLDPFRYAFVCHDAWEAIEPEVRVIPAGDRYSFRPDQLALFIARGQQATLEKLEQRLVSLESV